MHPDFQRLMQDATRLTRTGDLQGATVAIQAALGRGDTSPLAAAAPPASADVVIDVEARLLPDEPAQPDAQPQEQAQSRPQAQPQAAAPTHAASAGARAESFTAGRFGTGTSARDYKLYVPPHDGSRPLPLVVMLHGCTQDPDDFAAGTRMNDAAREAGCLVLYPAQSRQANPQGCWNWFKRTHQARGRGEAGLLAAMTQKIAAEHGADPSRIYVAGLSAGGAMAAILGETYPDLFAAVGVHSGLAAGSARDLQSALAAMKRGAPAASRSARTPTIVFHGDADGTVHPDNGVHVVASTAAAGAAPHVQRDRAPAGRDYTRSVHRASEGEVVAEHWVVHGSAHAWSGGSSAGSYTDPRGPDATAEMLRFFLEHPRSAS
jgi:poly(hydroxyalkanoate) depolymerase family esterase